MRLRWFCLVAMTLISTAALGGENSNRWHSMSSPAFTRCSAQNDCLGYPDCSGDVLEIGSECNFSCDFPNDPNLPVPCFSQSSAVPAWFEVSGSAGFFPCGGDTFPSADGWARGTRLSDSEFEIQASGEYAGEIPKIFEVSLFRFTGDPAQFNDLELNRIADLVDLGLIAATDIVFVTEIEGFDEILETVDVSGIPDQELVLFAAGDGLLPIESGCPEVPSVNWIGALALFVTIAFSGSLMLRSRG